jgi:hypothetical protein
MRDRHDDKVGAGEQRVEMFGGVKLGHARRGVGSATSTPITRMPNA